MAKAKAMMSKGMHKMPGGHMMKDSEMKRVMSQGKKIKGTVKPKNTKKK